MENLQRYGVQRVVSRYRLISADERRAVENIDIFRSFFACKGEREQYESIYIRKASCLPAAMSGIYQRFCPLFSDRNKKMIGESPAARYNKKSQTCKNRSKKPEITVKNRKLKREAENKQLKKREEVYEDF